MSVRPRVTIGVPAYNAERFLASTLDSLLAQTFQDFEIVISDNASTDGTRAICEQYVARDRRIRYVRNEVNLGAARNFNCLVSLGVGEYFKWAPADDRCRPDLVKRCVEVLDADPATVLACSGVEFVDATGAHLRTLDRSWSLMADDPSERFRKVVFAGGHGAGADALAGVMRRAALLRTGLFPLYQGGDKVLIGELSLIGKFVELPECWIIRTEHPQSSGSNNPAYVANKEAAIIWTMRFFGTGKNEILTPTWNLYSDHARTIARSGLPARRKLGLWLDVARAMSWSRGDLWSEVTALWVYRNLAVPSDAVASRLSG